MEYTAAVQQAPPHHRRPEPRYPTWLVAVITVSVLVVLTSLYVLSLHLAIDIVGTVEGDGPADSRDARYFLAHGVWVLIAAMAGVGFGTLFRRSAFGFAALFLSWMLVASVAAQLITFELACRGHNDIIRHWEC